MRQTPLLILAYNRPDKVIGLIDRLREIRPDRVMVAVDGPKPGRPADERRVAEVHAALERIDWTSDVEVRLRPVNLGLRRAVVDAVDWAIGLHGQAVIIEEDVLPGPDFLDYMTGMLDRFRDDERVAHVSGYNVVPQDILTHTTGSRFTIYPESIAWATWDRAWATFDPELTWARSCGLDELAAITGSRTAALRWKQNFSDAANERISTWAYRWIASMWSQRSLIVSPNQNLVTYAGADDGTHTNTEQAWIEQPVFTGDVETLLTGEVAIDERAEEWLSREVFHATPAGIARGVAVSSVLAARKLKRRLTA
ncbi:hypothetical protein [Leifsonia poae]|uniref:hypothetical protein n=1 Tax=Leifsonia poae TaxID=110933 RepID=UPI001CBBFEAE|nr:hypothetical protein [Leifsonia poae]